MCYMVQIIGLNAEYFNAFSNYELENDDMKYWIEAVVRDEWPEGKYVRDGAGVIQYVNGLEVVFINGVKVK